MIREAAKKKKAAPEKRCLSSCVGPVPRGPHPSPRCKPIVCSQPPCRRPPSLALGEAGDSSNPELSARLGVSRYYRDFAEAKADSESIVNADAVPARAPHRLPRR